MTVSVPVVGSWDLRAGLRARRGVDVVVVVAVLMDDNETTSSTASSLTRRGVLGEAVRVRLRLREEEEQPEGVSKGGAWGIMSSISGVLVVVVVVAVVVVGLASSGAV